MAFALSFRGRIESAPFVKLRPNSASPPFWVATLNVTTLPVSAGGAMVATGLDPGAIVRLPAE